MDETAQGGAPAPSDPNDRTDPIERAPGPEAEAEGSIAPPAGLPPDAGALPELVAGGAPGADTAECIATAAPLAPAPEWAADQPAAFGIPATTETLPRPAVVEEATAEPAVEESAVAEAPAAANGPEARLYAERIEAQEHFQEYLQELSQARSDTPAAAGTGEVDGDAGRHGAQRRSEGEEMSAPLEAPLKDVPEGEIEPAVAPAPSLQGVATDLDIAAQDRAAVARTTDAEEERGAPEAVPDTDGVRPEKVEPWPFEAGFSATPEARGPTPYAVARVPQSEAVQRTLPYLRRGVGWAGVVAAGLVATVLVLAVAYRWVNPPISTLMLGQSLAGTPIERTWVPIERISPNLIRAVVLSEDAGFCRHGGVDWSAIEEAIGSDRGGSTITMQVVKNLFLWPSRSYVRKAIEIGLAYLVESLWPKWRIMEIYLNVAEWGDGVFGAEAASRAHFDKRAARLTAQEAALLAVSLPSPIERTPAAPSLGTGRLASRLMLRMATSRADLSCLPVPRRAPRKAPLVPGPRLTL